MAGEVSLNSLQELEREVILQVLYRDQAVQNTEEERIRYAVPAPRDSLGAGLFLPTAQPDATWLAAGSLLPTGHPSEGWRPGGPRRVTELP